MESPEDPGETPSFEADDADVDVDELPTECRDALRRVAIYSTKPGRKVFVERDNTEGWISTDDTVEVLE